MPEPPEAGPPASTTTGGHEPKWLSTELFMLVAAVGVLLWLAGDVLLLVFAALLLAVGMDGLARGLAHYTPLSRKWSFTIVLVVAIVLAGLFGALVVPPFVEQLAEMWQRTVGFVEQQIEQLQEIGWARDLMQNSENQERIAGLAGSAAEYLAGLTMLMIGVVASLVVLIAIALFAAYDPDLYRRGTLKLFPTVYRDRLDRTFSATAYALRWWFLGQLVSMLLLGVTVAGGLFLIGVELWLGLGVLTALLTFIPFLGPIIAGVPIVIVGFGEGAEIGLVVLVFYLIVQNIEGNFIVPIIQQRAVHLAPALLISVQILMSVLFGVMGLVLAAPLTVVAMVAVKKLWMEEMLGEETEL
jgi:predicted PurR-regulated permease PerM